MRAVPALFAALPLALLPPAGLDGVDAPREVERARSASPAPRAVFAQERADRATGVVDGVVRGLDAPVPRVASRYPGAGGGATRSVQRIRPVVFLRGAVGDRTPARDGDGVVIAQEDTAFVPPLRVVRAGTTVVFPNRDSFFHNVFSYSSAARFDLGRYPRGESKAVTFDEPGIVKIYCEVHDFMRAAVLVVENRFHAVPDDDGRFRIEGVPPGTHELVAWDADRGTVEREVTVPDRGTARVELTFD